MKLFLLAIKNFGGWDMVSKNNRIKKWKTSLNVNLILELGNWQSGRLLYCLVRLFGWVMEMSFKLVIMAMMVIMAIMLLMIARLKRQRLLMILKLLSKKVMMPLKQHNHKIKLMTMHNHKKLKQIKIKLKVLL